MPFTGTDFNNQLDIFIDRAYTAYFSTPKRNVIVKTATLKAIKDRVEKNDRIETQSQLFGIYKTNQVITPVSNSIDITEGTGLITDYLYLMNLKAKFIVPYSGNYLIGATNASPIVVEFFKPINAQTGSYLLFQGASGNTNVNGYRYVKKITPTRFALYSDVNLISPVSGNGILSGTATASMVRYDMNFAKNLKANRKFSVLNKAEVTDPFYEIGSSAIYIYPNNIACAECTVDYISTPVFIDVTDSVTDILGVYSRDFINVLVDECGKLIGEIIRDMGLMQNSIIEINQA